MQSQALGICYMTAGIPILVPNGVYLSEITVNTFLLISGGILIASLVSFWVTWKFQKEEEEISDKTETQIKIAERKSIENEKDLGIKIAIPRVSNKQPRLSSLNYALVSE